MQNKLLTEKERHANKPKAYDAAVCNHALSKQVDYAASDIMCQLTRAQ